MSQRPDCRALGLYADNILTTVPPMMPHALRRSRSVQRWIPGKGRGFEFPSPPLHQSFQCITRTLPIFPSSLPHSCTRVDEVDRANEQAERCAKRMIRAQPLPQPKHFVADRCPPRSANSASSRRRTSRAAPRADPLPARQSKVEHQPALRRASRVDDRAASAAGARRPLPRMVILTACRTGEAIGATSLPRNRLIRNALRCARNALSPCSWPA